MYGSTIGCKEVAWSTWLEHVHVIIQVDKMFAQVGDSMQVSFDGVRVERGEVFRGNDLIMVDEADFGMGMEERGGLRTHGHDVNVAHKGEVFECELQRGVQFELWISLGWKTNLIIWLTQVCIFDVRPLRV